MEFIFFVLFICIIIFRGLLFSARDEKWYKTLIPGYNKYILGKLCDAKKLGVIIGVISVLFVAALIAYASVEIYAIQNYATLAKIPENINEASTIYITLPAMYIDILTGISYGALGLAIIYLTLWIIITRKFSLKQDKTSWWMFGWIICPLIPYVYFSVVDKTVYIPNIGLVTNITVRETTNGKSRSSKASRRRSR